MLVRSLRDVWPTLALAPIHLIDAGTRVPHVWYAGPVQPAAFVADMRAALSATSENPANR